MSKQNKTGYITQNATFEIDGRDIVARIDGQIVDRVDAEFNVNDRYGYDHRSGRSWLEALTYGCLDVDGYGHIYAHNGELDWIIAHA